MIHLYDRADFARVAALNIDPELKLLLTQRIEALRTPYGDLTESTEFLVVQPGDTEASILWHIGFSPLVEPIDGARFGQPGFAPGWDHLLDRDFCFEMTVSFGSAFAYVLLIENKAGVPADLLDLCRRYSTA
jgi:hypothetical protein